MLNSITVNISQEDIDKGERGMTGCCPIALAIRRLPNIRSAHVGVQSVQLITTNNERVVMLHDGMGFIWAFDHNVTVAPRQVTLRPFPLAYTS